MESYCVKCKAKRVMEAAEQGTTKNGKPMVRGLCPECATVMVRINATLPAEAGA